MRSERSAAPYADAAMNDPDEVDDLPAPLRSDRAREWLSFEDTEEERTWVFDVTFLTSSWTCIYGAGCPGTEDGRSPERMIGCCDHGAYLGGDEDVALVERRIAQLDADEWQLADRADALGGALFVDDDGHTRTRVVDGACVMLNRPDHPSGGGCALHQAAWARDEAIHDWKPEVCWQAPIRREDLVDTYGHVWSHIRDWRRRDWGDGGLDFAWWCVEEPEAYVATEPVYVHAEADLRRLTTDAVYERLRAALDALGREVPVSLAPPSAGR